mgnify:CR=1 FL=1
MASEKQQVENIWMCVCTIPGLELRRALTCRWQVVLREPTSSPGIVVSAINNRHQEHGRG